MSGGGWVEHPGEESCYRTTPRYAETMKYVRRIAQAAPRQVKIEKFGTTGEGRALVAVIVSRDGVFSPTALHRSKRPIIFIQNSIHAGEMDGKDASLALLRDVLGDAEQARLIERAVLVVVPIYNADGHRRWGRSTASTRMDRSRWAGAQTPPGRISIATT